MRNTARQQALPARWEPAIGLEFHIQLKTRTKLFCGCRNTSAAEPNQHTCPVCLGYPGVLPVLNRQALHLALKFGAAVGARLQSCSYFERKNYFYPDLPKGYQITQHGHPLFTGGSLWIWWQEKLEEIVLAGLHLEEDAAKTIHAGRSRQSRLDFNRCGIPLIEVVTTPVLHHPRQARLVLLRIQQLVRQLEVSQGDLEKGQLRCDANLSLRAAGGVRTEIKNLNSGRALVQSLWAEIERQGRLLAKGEEVVPVTLSWEAPRRRNIILRLKETVPDYRYFPEPDLPPVRVDPGLFRKISAGLPEPLHRQELRWRREYDLPPGSIRSLARDRDLKRYFEYSLKQGIPARLAARWISETFRGLVRKRGGFREDFPIGPERLAELLDLVAAGTLTAAAGRQVLVEMLTDRRPAAEIVEAGQLGRKSGRDELARTIRLVLQRHPREVARYRRGHNQLLDFLMGAVMRDTAGRYDPGLVREVLERELAG